MEYSSKWINDNLGITLKTIIGYEENGALPYHKPGEKRMYDEEGINRLWQIKMLQSMGYSVKEIAGLMNDPNTDFQKSLGEKIRLMEKRKEDLERSLRYAKYIQKTGRIFVPSEMGTVKYEDFEKELMKKFDQEYDRMFNAVDRNKELAYKSERKITEEDLFDLLEIAMDLLKDDRAVQAGKTIQILFEVVMRRMNLGYRHPEVQLTMKILHEDLYHLNDAETQGSERQFASYVCSSFTGDGDIAKSNRDQYGKEACEFFANAAAFYAGYSDCRALMDDEWLSVK